MGGNTQLRATGHARGVWYLQGESSHKLRHSYHAIVVQTIYTELCANTGRSEYDESDAQRGLAAPEWQPDSIEAEQLSPVHGSSKVPIQGAPIGIEAALEGCAIIPPRPVECLQ